MSDAAGSGVRGAGSPGGAGGSGHSGTPSPGGAAGSGRSGPASPGGAGSGGSAPNRDDTPPPLKLDAWLDLLRRQPAVGGGEIDRATERALLELARVAAHASERIAGPISTYLVGLALAEVPAEERAGQIQALVDALEQETGVQD